MRTHFLSGPAASFAPSRRARNGGFTLVELMVGLLLGMLTVLVISQVLAMSEGKKRSIATGSNAMVNGALALYTLQRELQMAGYGLAYKPEALGCPLQGTFTAPGTPAVSETFTGTLAPVIITDGGTDGSPDTLTLLQSRKASYAVPVMVNSQSTTYYTVLSSLGTQAGDLMVAVPSAWNATTPCRLFNATDDGAGSPSNTGLWALRVPHTESTTTTSWNNNTTLALSPASYLLNLGSLGYSTFSINSSTQALQTTTRTATAASSTSELFPQIVNLQAMYGKDTNSDGVVDTYNNVTPANNAEWRQVLTIRIAVVARSTQYEKSKADESDAVTQTAPLWDLGASSTVTGAAACHSGSKCVALKIDQVPDWKHYRYKVYDTIVPLRNILWNTAS
ncbi:PilW family protein [Variovorax robiniae]|uniref:PilW family protein n=1 Tax=Variovorax robiniae TaxID=1836199 RepID=A0ABU8XI77_9BURK